MVRGIPAIFATRSGAVLASKIVTSLNKIVSEKELMLANSSNAKDQKDWERIQEMKDANLRLFGKNEICTRVSLAENFSDGEIHVQLPDYVYNEKNEKIVNSVRGNDVYLIHAPYEPSQNPFQQPERSVHDNIIEGLILGYTLSKWAQSVTLICPFHPYTRQDYAREREASVTKLLARITEVARFNHAIFLDLHSDQIPQFYGITVDNLRASFVLIKKVEEIKKKDVAPLIIMSPDAGGAKRARYYAKRLETEVVIGDKRRDYAKHNAVESVQIIGEVKNKRVCIVDDMVDTGGTIQSIIEKVHAEGAKDIFVVCSHAILSGKAIERMDKLFGEKKLQKLITTDSITRPKEFAQTHPWYTEVSIASIFAQAIFQMTMEGSVSHVYEASEKIPQVKF